MAVGRAVIAPISRGIVLFCFPHGIGTIAERTQVQSVLFVRQPITIGFVDFVISVVLCVLVYIIRSHDTTHFPQKLADPPTADPTTAQNMKGYSVNLTHFTRLTSGLYSCGNYGVLKIYLHF
jgi:hypothetical protein